MRNYRKEYDTYHGTPKQRRNRSRRNKARRMLAKAGRVRKGDGLEVEYLRHGYVPQPLEDGDEDEKNRHRDGDPDDSAEYLFHGVHLLAG